MKKIIALTLVLVPVLLVASYVHQTIERRSPKEQVVADTVVAKRPAVRSTFGVFVDDENAKKSPLHIVSMKASTDIRGTLATTTLEIVVYNPNDRILEGQFSFPVADGQTVSRFALDLNGKLRDAVVVDKSKARVTFEAIERRGVDPALLEWTRDNAFRTRIYPIMPRNTRRVLIAYEQDLSQGADGMQYTLPIAVDDTVDVFTWDVSVAAFGSTPQLSGNNTEQVSFSNRGRQFTSTVKRNKFLITHPFVIDVPVVPAAQVITVNDHSGEQYASIVVATPNVAATSAARVAPRSIAIAWDASLSGAKRDHQKELQFFAAYFDRNRNVEVNLHVFAHETILKKKFSVRDGRWVDLQKVLLGLTYDGATQLGIVPFSEFRTDLTFLVSDGLSTFGKSMPDMGTSPVMGLVASTFADVDVLRAICIGTGGSVFDLRVTSVKDVMASIFTTRLMLASVRVLDGAMEAVYPRASVEAGLCNTIVGKLKSAAATLELTYTLNGEEVSRKELVVNTAEHKVDGLTAARQWAQQEVASLAGNRRTNADAIMQLGLRFGVVTPGTSLLVLESLNDYMQYDIKPPASEPELVYQWNAWKKDHPKVAVQSADVRLAYLTSLVSSWKSWYLKPIVKKSTSDTVVANVSNAAIPRISGVSGIITGLVTGVDGKFVSGATVRVIGTTRGAVTKLDSRYIVQNVAAGRYPVRVTAVGYDTVTKEVDLSANETLDLNFTVISNGARLHIMDVSAQPEMVLSTSIGVASVAPDKMTKIARDNVASAITVKKGSGSPTIARSVSEDDVQRNPISVMDEVNAQTEGYGLEYGKAIGGIVNTTDRNPSTQSRATQIPTAPLVMHRDAWCKSMQASTKDSMYTWYLSSRDAFGKNVGFYLDVSDALREKGLNILALRVLTNLAELEGENHQMLRILARRLMQLDQPNYAVEVFKDVLTIRDEEPQSYRDLALALDAAGQHQKAVVMLYEMALQKWDGRFPEVELIALNEMNHIIGANSNLVDVSGIPEQLRYSVASDIRVVVDWDSDNCDIDLWVTEPTQEKCYYSHRNTRSGGRLSHDLTGGYGPEEYMLKTAPTGSYKVQANFYGDRQQRITGPTTIQVTVYRNYGSPTEQRQSTTVRLKRAAQVVDLATIKID